MACIGSVAFPEGSHGQLPPLLQLGKCLSQKSLYDFRLPVLGMHSQEINAARLFKGEEEVIFPHTTAIGSLPYYVTHAESKHFQPMNVNFGIIKELEGPRIRDKKERYEKIAERALKDLQPFIQA